MARITADRVLETSTTTGTGAYTLAGTIAGYRTAASVCANGDTFTYYAEDIDISGRAIGDWETGLGTWSTGNILTRTTIYASSNAGSAVSWAAGTRRIALGFVAASYNSLAPLASPTFTGNLTADSIVVTSNIGKTNGTAPAYWLSQDGTGRQHWYWNTTGGTSPTFAVAGEDASDIMTSVDNAGNGAYFQHRTASGVGKVAGDAITWTTTIFANLTSFTYKGNTVWHTGNDGIGSGLDADLLDGQHGSYYAPTANPTFTGSVTASSGIKLGSAAHPTYGIQLDFGADVANTWRKIVTVALGNEIYSTHGFIVDIFDPLANHATQPTPNQVVSSRYYVACVRTEGTTLDTPDLCVVKGPSNHVRAVKTSAGNYEIQVQNSQQYQEYSVQIRTFATNGTHTITYNDGSTTGSTGTAQYAASVGSAVDWFQNVKATKYESTVATGTAPLTVASTTAVTNLNADLLDGQHGSYYAPITNPTFLNSVNLPAATTFLKENTTGEGGQFYMQRSDTSTLPGELIVDLNGNSLRFFEAGGTFRGAYFTISEQAAGVASKILTSTTLTSSHVTTALGYTPASGSTVSDETIKMMIAFS